MICIYKVPSIIKGGRIPCHLCMSVCLCKYVGVISSYNVFLEACSTSSPGCNKNVGEQNPTIQTEPTGECTPDNL